METDQERKEENIEAEERAQSNEDVVGSVKC